jgi:hypothetical protein
MRYVRVNALLREPNLTIERLAELMLLDSINPNEKLGIVDNNEIIYSSLSNNDLLSIREVINKELNSRLLEIEEHYLSFRDKVKGKEEREL